MNPDYPVYIISKGRHESRKTSKALERMSVPYHIVVEPQEYDAYASVIDPAKILVLPFSNLGQGSIPARNWVWEHSIERGAERHWILDDNIRIFYRLHKNKKYVVSTGSIFKSVEGFVNRYSNVALAGFEYAMFIAQGEKHQPFAINRRVYSCILIKNDIPYRWRGKYNEDTDLSLRVLKDGWCTILFYAFLAHKEQTQTMKGGNTDLLYKDTTNRLEFAQSLQEQHPDCVTIQWKYNRWHHKVDYSKFRKNKLIRRDDIDFDNLPKVDNYGMQFKYMGDE